MKLADDTVTGQLIEPADSREQWLALVRALQVASEAPGAPLAGWVFHGTSATAAEAIAREGLAPSYAIAATEPDPAPGDWIETAAVHFGSANVAAFFAEDLIWSHQDRGLELAIFGARLADLARCGPLGADGQMADVPLYSRLRRTKDDVERAWEASSKDWRASLEVLETVLVLAVHLVQFRCVQDLKDYLAAQARCGAASNDCPPVPGTDGSAHQDTIERANLRAQPSVSRQGRTLR